MGWIKLRDYVPGPSLILDLGQYSLPWFCLSEVFPLHIGWILVEAEEERFFYYF